MSSEPTNIRTLFASATKLRLQLDDLHATSTSYQENLQSAISKLEECRVLVDSLSLFSDNETLDDISSKDIEFLSIDYFLADLLVQAPSSNRQHTIRNAQEAYERYLGRLEAYDLLSSPDKKLFERYLSNRAEFSLVATSDVSIRRDTKIARFKVERELKDKLKFQSANPSTLIDDEAAFRSLRLDELSLHTHRAFQALDLIAQEYKILALAPSPLPDPSALEYDDRLRSRHSTNSYSARLDAPLSSLLNNSSTGPILSKEGKPLKPFTLLDSRQRLRNGVFRPDHNLPTMTIDEYLAEERRRGGIIDGGGEQSGVAVEIDEDDMDAADKETAKKREWDEFVEANPKGSGNTLNRG